MNQCGKLHVVIKLKQGYSKRCGQTFCEILTRAMSYNINSRSEFCSDLYQNLGSYDCLTQQNCLSTNLTVVHTMVSYSLQWA